MIMHYLRTGFATIKDGLQAVIFSVLSNTKWLEAFNASVASKVTNPIFGLLMIALLILQMINMGYSTNITLESILGLTGNFLSTTFSSVSIFGGFISFLLGTTFALGPMFFLGALAVGFFFQFLQLALNIRRAYESEPGSTQRMHYAQAAANQVWLPTPSALQE